MVKIPILSKEGLILDRKEHEYWSTHSDLIVRQSDFDKGIYVSTHNRSGKEEYFSSHQLSASLNDSKVIVLNRRGKIIHRNFKMIAEVIG